MASPALGRPLQDRFKFFLRQRHDLGSLDLRFLHDRVSRNE